MKKSFLLLLTLLSAITFILTGCEEELDSSKQSKGYLELLKLYDAGALFDYVDHVSGGYVVHFAEEKSVSVSDMEFRIDICQNSEPKAVSQSNGAWRVGTVLTGIKVLDSSIPNNEAEPIYVYYDKVTLHMYVSNGNHLVFGNVFREPTEEEIIAKNQNIPVVYINTDDKAPIVDKKNYVKGTIKISDPESLYSDVKTFETRMGIRGRGNSTWGMPKKPWKVKLDEKASILGMPADKEWALLANFADKTLLRNIVAMKLSEICGFAWTPRMRSVEVFLNDEYQGVYTFCEHKKVSKDRVNIDLVTEDDNTGDAVTGGYYLELEDNQDETTVWRTELCNIPMMFSDPEVPTAQQLAYVKKYIDDFEYAIKNSNVDDPDNGYGRFMDIKSFVDNYIIQELTKNPDGNTRKSTFLTKERGKKLEMYHIWDFDLALGNTSFSEGAGPETWLIKYCSGWYTPMMNDPLFVEKVKERWNELKPEFEKVADFIERQALYLDKAQKRNFEVWDIKQHTTSVSAKGSYEAEVKHFRDWYAARVAWIDEELNK